MLPVKVRKPDTEVVCHVQPLVIRVLGRCDPVTLPKIHSLRSTKSEPHDRPRAEFLRSLIFVKRSPTSFATAAQEKNQNIKKQNAMNEPMIIPSRLFLADILVIRVLIPGTWLAARVIRRLMCASRSRWDANESCTAYAWLSTLSATSWLRSSLPRSSSM